MNVRKAELTRIVLGESFPLFVENIYKVLEKECSNNEDLLIATSSLTDALIMNFPLLTLEHVLGTPSADEENPSDETAIDESKRVHIVEYVFQALSFYDELQSLTRSQIQQQHGQKIEAYLIRRQEKLRKLGEKHDKEAFFNDVEAQADWKFWNSKISWTPQEFVALSFGKDPRIVNEASLSQLKPLAGSPFRDEFSNRIDDLNRAINAKIIKFPLQKAALARWASSIEIALPTEMIGRNINNYPERIHGNKLHNLYDIILGLAIKHYGYNILISKENAQTPIAKEIAESLKGIGAKISSKSVIRYLRKARDWAYSETSHSLIAEADKRAKADGRRSAALERQKPQTKVSS